MKISHLKYLSDPITLNKLKVVIYKKYDNEIIDGLLIQDDIWFPIILGVPRLLLGKLKDHMLINNKNFYFAYKSKFPIKIKKYWGNLLSDSKLFDDYKLTHQVKTGDSFAFEWNKIYHENNYERNNFLHFLSPFTDSKKFKNKIVLDAGCGSGRFSKHSGLFGSKLTIGMDLGESVVGAYNLTRYQHNVLIVQGDIYNPPFKAIFDLIYSIGVLHHLPEPQKGFDSLTNKLKRGGTISIWVYNRRNNNRAIYFYEPIRVLSRQLPKNILYKLCYVPALIVHLINLTTKKLNNPPFAYYRNFPFNMKLNDAFDVLATPKSNYYFVEEIENWYKQINLRKINVYEHPEAGITCIGTK